MTSVHIHQNETIFPEAQKFKPERWLEARPEGAPPLDRYLVSFTKGSRQCVGMQYVMFYRGFIFVLTPLPVLRKLNYGWQSRRLFCALTSKSSSKPPDQMLISSTISSCPRPHLIAKEFVLFSSRSLKTLAVELSARGNRALNCLTDEWSIDEVYWDNANNIHDQEIPINIMSIYTN